MKNSLNGKGFILIELLITIALIVIVVIWGLSIGGNQWFTEETVLRKLRAEHPNVTEIVDTQRNIWNYSEIKVKENGKLKTYLLDSNILFNYEIHEKLSQ